MVKKNISAKTKTTRNKCKYLKGKKFWQFFHLKYLLLCIETDINSELLLVIIAVYLYYVTDKLKTYLILAYKQ